MSKSRCINCMKKIDAGIACPHCGALQQADPNYPYAMRPNTILHGKYLIGRVLGQGGFGITYVGFDLALEIKVAVKEYFPQGLAGRSGSSSQIIWNRTQVGTAESEQSVQSFLKEARRMAKLDSLPAIVRVRDTFQENGTAYIVMDFVNGMDLKSGLKKNGIMTFENCVRFLEPLMDSLEKMHAKELIHRDISPDNIMVQPDGKPCLLDLGAAKDLTRSGSQSTQMVMKQGFSPLEQCTSGGNIGPWTDVYALTATIYYCITGKLVPNVMDRAYNTNYNGSGAALDFTTVSGQSLPPAVCSVLNAGLALRAEDRIQTIGELRTALKNACRGIPYSGGNSGGDAGGGFGGTNGSGGGGSTGGTSSGTSGNGGSGSGGENHGGSGGSDSEGSGGNSGSGTHGGAGKSKKKLGLLAIAAAAVVVVVGIAVAVGGNGNSVNVVSDTDDGIEVTEVTIADASGNVMMADAYNEDEDVHYVLGGSYERKDIYTITFVDSIEENSTAWDVSAAGDGSVMAWVETNDSGYDLYIGGDGGVDLTDGSYLFYRYSNVEEIDFNSCVYTGDVEYMSYMFAQCISLTSLDLNGFDTSNVTKMNHMFYGCRNLVSVNLSSFDTSNVKLMGFMFAECVSLASLDLSSFNTSNVINMNLMFYDCSSLTSLDLSNFDTSNVVQMNSMFYGCGVSAEEAGLDVSLIDQEMNVLMTEDDSDSVLGSAYDRDDVVTVTFVDYVNDSDASWDVSAAEDGSVRAWVSQNESGTGFDLYIGGEGGVVLGSGENLFYNYKNVTDINFNSCLYTGNAESMADMFDNCFDLKELDLSGFDTSNVTDMSWMFGNCTSLVSLNVSSFDTSSVTTMAGMFQSCRSLTELDLSSFDTSSVTSMSYMFKNCESLTSLDLSHFSLSSLSDSGAVDMLADAGITAYEAGLVDSEDDAYESEYILPDSSTTYLTMDDLEGLTAEECRIARNEIYARHGRRFSEEELQSYFDSCSWYTGTTDPEDFDGSVLNDYEEKNLALIVQYEEEQGYR